MKTAIPTIRFGGDGGDGGGSSGGDNDDDDGIFTASVLVPR